MKLSVAGPFALMVSACFYTEPTSGPATGEPLPCPVLDAGKDTYIPDTAVDCDGSRYIGVCLDNGVVPTVWGYDAKCTTPEQYTEHGGSRYYGRDASAGECADVWSGEYGLTVRCCP